jgi:hypothetical protein
MFGLAAFGAGFTFGNHWIGKILIIGGPGLVMTALGMGIWKYSKSFFKGAKEDPKKSHEGIHRE